MGRPMLLWLPSSETALELLPKARPVATPSAPRRSPNRLGLATGSNPIPCWRPKQGMLRDHPDITAMIDRKKSQFFQRLKAIEKERLFPAGPLVRGSLARSLPDASEELLLAR